MAIGTVSAHFCHRAVKEAMPRALMFVYKRCIRFETPFSDDTIQEEKGGI